MNSFSNILLDHLERSNSRLCVGLDIDTDRLSHPSSSTLDDLKDYVRKVIDATLDSAAAYKVNFAFYERHGGDGYHWLEEVVRQIDGRRLVIADAKRGDIANSAKHYATAILGEMGFDAVTVSPYMGRDAIEPFLNRPDKGAFVLCVTSNEGATDLQLQRTGDGFIYEKVVSLVSELNQSDNCGLVVGATRSEMISDVRRTAGDVPFLIPGVGAQGGDLEASVRAGNEGGVALINVSRAIMYAGDQSEFAIRKAAEDYCTRINATLE
ncbi:MAG: orotidine-5'-phosphate decarboxylase [Candidatus Marinimicrobia bacterium]|nr:orotidine-5'-phosphate decarboxylase [Candidatus Neomarinimicrobiota bacterium]